MEQQTKNINEFTESEKLILDRDEKLASLLFYAGIESPKDMKKYSFIELQSLLTEAYTGFIISVLKNHNLNVLVY